MSRARPVIKGVTLMLTRRTRGRQFLLRPSETLNNIVGYVLAVMAKKRKIVLHAVDVQSNHWHLVLTDPKGNVARFQQDCHSFIARGLNAHYGEVESIWKNTQGSRVRCEMPNDTIAKIAYTMANPVEAALVREGHQWPGLRCAWPQERMCFTKPKKFFRGKEQGGEWPEEAYLELSRPPGYEEMSDEEFAELIEYSIEVREESFRKQYDAEGRRFLGRKAVLAQSRHARPKSAEPGFGISPTLACQDKWRRIERLQQDRDWRDWYADSLDRWCAGDRDVEFPPDTYKMCWLHGASSAAAG